MAAYYNENDEKTAAWLRELINAGEIAWGIVDERDIRDVLPSDLRGFTQCHFFAGIGGWSAALRLAAWPDDRAAWTGSCPCQPFSAAGAGGGFADERHLWPHFLHLMQHAKPRDVPCFGEQVAGKAGRTWFDLVRRDLAAIGHASWASDLAAASVGAPHIRQRLFWVAYGYGYGYGRQARPQPALHDAEHHAEPRGGAGGLAHSSSARLEGRDAREVGRQLAAAERGGEVGGLGHSELVGTGRDAGAGAGAQAGAAVWAVGDNAGAPGAACRTRPTDGFWRDADWLACRDGTWRPVEPGTFPLAHGVPARVVRGSDPSAPISPQGAEARVMRLRGYGNAIVPAVAAAFIETFCEVVME